MLRANEILAPVDDELLARVQERCSLVELERGLVLHRSGEELTQLYFPTSAIIALGAETVLGEGVNVMLVGHEGALGVFEACGSRQTHAQATVQIAGAAWRMPAGVYRRLFADSAELRLSVHKYVEILLAEARQHVACNALHSVDKRLARTLLEFSDKRRSHHLPITQHALSQLLGVQRTTVAASVSDLQRQGLIRSGRGALDITDKAGLEATACACRETLAFTRRDIHSRAMDPCER